MSICNIIGNGDVRGITSRKVDVPYLYAIGSTVYSRAQAKNGVQFPITIATVDFPRNVSSFGFFVFYNNTYYEDELCDGVTAIKLALAYWSVQKEIMLQKLACACNQEQQGPFI